MNEIASHLLAFLIGGFTGAAGHYLGEKYTDKRRKQEARSEVDAQWLKLYASMPVLLDSIKGGLAKHPMIREVVVLPTKGVVIGGSPQNPRFVYYESEHEGLRTKLGMLAEAGYVVDIRTKRDTPIFRMTEKLVERLLNA